MFTERNYVDLSNDVYKLDLNNIDYDRKLKEGVIIKKDNELDYKVLKTVDNTSNSMQALAVAPVKDGETDTSEIVIVYAGTKIHYMK